MMDSIIANDKKKHKQIMMFMSSSLLCVLFLFFIDEGFYSFNWMTDFGNWIAFMIYLVGLFVGQYVSYRLINGVCNERLSLLLCMVFGTIVSLLFLFKVIFN